MTQSCKNGGGFFSDFKKSLKTQESTTSIEFIDQNNPYPWWARWQDYGPGGLTTDEINIIKENYKHKKNDNLSYLVYNSILQYQKNKGEDKQSYWGRFNFFNSKDEPDTENLEEFNYNY